MNLQQPHSRNLAPSAIRSQTFFSKPMVQPKLAIEVSNSQQELKVKSAKNKEIISHRNNSGPHRIGQAGEALDGRMLQLQSNEEEGSTRDISEEQRQELCIGLRPGEGPERFEFNHRQRRIVSLAKTNANWVISRALLAIDSGDRYIRKIAATIFQDSNLTSTFIRGKIIQIRDKMNSATIVGGSCHDEDCYTPGVVAHALPDSNTIVLCRAYFGMKPGEWRRYLVHEAAHNVGIDAQRISEARAESYCQQEAGLDCLEVCDNLSDPVNNVDAWAHFIDCAGFSF